MQHSLSQHELVSGAKLTAINVPRAASAYLGSYIRSGWAFAPRELYELSHVLEHLAFEGTKTYPDPLQFKSAVERNGAYFNAFTSDYLNWYEMVGEGSELERLLPIALSQLFEPVYSAERIVQQQETVVNELLRYQESDHRRLRYFSNRNLMPGWYPDYEERIKTTKAIKRSDLTDFHEHFYHPANLSFVIAGDLSRSRIDGVIAQLNEFMTSLPARKLAALPKPPVKQGKLVQAHEPFRKNQSMFLLRSNQFEMDIDGAAALRIISTMYTSGLSSRMNMKAREAGLTYVIGSSPELAPYRTGFSVSSETAVEKLQPLVELSLKELSALAAGDYSDEELARAQGYAAGQLKRSFETPSSLAGWYGDDAALGMPLVSPEDWIKRLNKVDRDEVARVATKYLNREAMTLTLIGHGLKSEVLKYEELLKRYF